MIYKVLTMIAMLAVATGMPMEKRLALLEAKVDTVHDAMLAAQGFNLDDDEEEADVDEQKSASKENNKEEVVPIKEIESAIEKDKELIRKLEELQSRKIIESYRFEPYIHTAENLKRRLEEESRKIAGVPKRRR